MLTFVLIKKFFIDLLRLLQFFQTLKRLPLRKKIFNVLPVRRLKKVENHWSKTGVSSLASLWGHILN